MKRLLFTMTMIQMVIISDTAHAGAEPIYLQCKELSDSGHPIGSFYSKPPASNDAYLKDIWDAGLLGVVTAPGTSWKVDVESKTISGVGNPKAYQIYSTNDIEITGGRVSPSGEVEYSFSLDRITGKLTLRNSLLTTHDSEEWRSKHGKLFPSIWMWTQSCSRVQPAM